MNPSRSLGSPPGRASSPFRRPFSMMFTPSEPLDCALHPARRACRAALFACCSAMLCLLFGALATGPVGAQDDAVDDDPATPDVQGQAEQADGTADGGDALKEGTELPPDHAERMREGLTLFRD